MAAARRGEYGDEVHEEAEEEEEEDDEIDIDDSDDDDDDGVPQQHAVPAAVFGGARS